MSQCAAWNVLAVAAGLLVGPAVKAAEPLNQQAPPPAVDPSVHAFLKSYCTQCHGGDEPKGDRPFDRLPAQISDEGSLIDFQDILDQLNLAEMPPADAPQPGADEKQAVIRHLTESIASYHQWQRGTARETVLRRLNAREYRNTVRDLLTINMTMFDPTATFPKDQTTQHLDNVGDTLVTSGYLLARYLEAAEAVVDKALRPLTRPPVQTWEFRNNFRQQPEIDQVHGKTNGFSHITLYDVTGADKHEGAYGPLLEFREGVPFDGFYELRIRAEAVNREHPYDPEFLGTDPSEPLRLGIVAGNIDAGALHKPQPVEPLLAEIDLEDESRWYTVRIWLDKGFTPRFTFRNGLMDVRNLWSRLLKKYPEQFPERTRPGIVEARFNAIKFGKLPQIHIHEVEIEGPLYEQWPPRSRQELVGEDWERLLSEEGLDDGRLRQHLERFVMRAYRRPPSKGELDRLLKFVRKRQQAGRSPVEAFGDGLAAVLCSPNFLYLEEQSGDPKLSSYAIASRLAYFLWSSMPDEQLRSLAHEDRLLDPDQLISQVERMLDDPRSDAFIEGFLDSWLTLRDLGATPPDRSMFRDYYHYDLGPAMRRETDLFVRHLIDENLGIVNFLDAEFAFVNKPLAELYGIDRPDADRFEFVRVGLSDRRRGGLLGQASVLTVTANGIDTSPVVRGVWLLENILGTPPSPPPPDVEPLDPDIRGARTIREQLSRHRDVSSCYDCHRKIDPLGFALENFNPIGAWRETYDRGQKIEAAGELPNGSRFENVIGLKAILVEQRQQFARALTDKLLAYAIGRPLTPDDRPHVDDVVARLFERGGGFRDLLTLVVLSEPFHSK